MPSSLTPPDPEHSPCLFLGLLSFGLFLGTFLPDALESRIASCPAQLRVSPALNWLGHVALLYFGDALAERLEGEGVLDVRDSLDLAEIRVLAVTRLGLAALAWEDDQSGLVGFEALDISDERLFAEVLAAGIDGNANGGRDKTGNTSGLYDGSVILTSPNTEGERS